MQSGLLVCGILDNDYKAAFYYVVLLWVFKVLAAKGLDMSVIERFKNIYKDNITVVVVNNILGKSFKNLRCSIRQGDCPSSILFNFGIDPHLTWLDRRLKGIPIYKQPAQVTTVPTGTGNLQSHWICGRCKTFYNINE